MNPDIVCGVHSRLVMPWQLYANAPAVAGLHVYPSIRGLFAVAALFAHEVLLSYIPKYTVPCSLLFL